MRRLATVTSFELSLAGSLVAEEQQSLLRSSRVIGSSELLDLNQYQNAVLAHYYDGVIYQASCGALTTLVRNLAEAGSCVGSSRTRDIAYGPWGLGSPSFLGVLV